MKINIYLDKLENQSTQNPLNDIINSLKDRGDLLVLNGIIDPVKFIYDCRYKFILDDHYKVKNVEADERNEFKLQLCEKIGDVSFDLIDEATKKRIKEAITNEQEINIQIVFSPNIRSELILFPWEFIGAKNENNTSIQWFGASDKVILSRNFNISNGNLEHIHNNLVDSINVLFIDITENQQFFEYFSNETNQDKLKFKCLGRGAKNENKASLYNLQIIMSNFNPQIVHYIIDSDQINFKNRDEHDLLLFEDNKNILAHFNVKEILSKKSIKFFIFQEWLNTPSIGSNFEYLELKGFNFSQSINSNRLHMERDDIQGVLIIPHQNFSFEPYKVLTSLYRPISEGHLTIGRIIQLLRKNYIDNKKSYCLPILYLVSDSDFKFNISKPSNQNENYIPDNPEHVKQQIKSIIKSFHKYEAKITTSEQGVPQADLETQMEILLRSFKTNLDYLEKMEINTKEFQAEFDRQKSQLSNE